MMINWQTKFTQNLLRIYNYICCQCDEWGSWVGIAIRTGVWFELKTIIVFNSPKVTKDMMCDYDRK